MRQRRSIATDPREKPAYSPVEASAYLRIPVSTVRAWATGQKGFRQVLEPAQRSPLTLSYWNLVELYVLGSIRRDYQVRMPRVRQALEFMKKKLKVERPLLSKALLTDGVDLFVDKYCQLINVSQAGQLVMRDLLVGSLRRIERDTEGLPIKLYPWARSTDEPRIVEIDPFRSFGRLVLVGTGIPTEVIAGRFNAGETIEELAEDFTLSPAQIEAAIRWERPIESAA